MGYIIEVSEDKFSDLTEHIGKGLRHLGKAMQCAEDMYDNGYGYGERDRERDDEDWDDEDRMGERGYGRGRGRMGMRRRRDSRGRFY